MTNTSEPTVGKRFVNRNDVPTLIQIIGLDAKKIDNLEQQVLVDSLTGLYNRAYLQREIPKLELSARHAFAMVMFDLDNLKPTNDRHGHASGDTLIKNTAALLKGTFRPGDIIIHLSGDEFVAVLPFDIDNLQAEYSKFLHQVTENSPPSIEEFVATRISSRLTQ